MLLFYISAWIQSFCCLCKEFTFSLTYSTLRPNSCIWRQLVRSTVDAYPSEGQQRDLDVMETKAIMDYFLALSLSSFW